jgi:hypothetical protein
MTTNQIRSSKPNYTSADGATHCNGTEDRDDHLSVVVDRWTYDHGKRQRLDAKIYPRPYLSTDVGVFNGRDPFVTISVGDAIFFISHEQAAALRDQLNERL